jgi:alpha-galactosidase/6-phospho-beta-glucosidase family protein
MPPLSKRELTKHMQRFYADKDRGISIALFAELAGISHGHFHDVFIYNEEPLTENVQKRVSKAYQQWKAGNVKVMKRIDNTRYVDYRKESQPVFKPKNGSASDLRWHKNQSWDGKQARLQRNFT